MTLQFWFEFGSTYSYPAAMRIEADAARAGVAVEWKAFLLGPIFRDQGWEDSPFNLYPAKGRYMWRDLARICDARGIPYRRPTVFPRNGLLAARVVAAHPGAPWLPAFTRAVYSANFRDDLDISDPAVVAACAESAGQSSETALACAAQPDAKAALRASTEEAAALGLFGAPSFRVGDELFWGDDRLDEALRWASASPS